MESVDAKLARAKEHLRAFDAESLEFFKLSRPTFIRKTNGAEHWLVCYTQDPFPPMRLSVLVGDVLHNLRSTLDSLVCGLIKTGDPASVCDKSEFPIFIDQQEYAKKASRLLKGVPEPACKMIESFQPWARPESTRQIDPLWSIHSLHNHDKHRAVHLTVCAHRGLGIIVPMKNGVGVQVSPEPVVLAMQPAIIPLPGNPNDFDDSVNVHISGRTVLFFGGQPALASLPVSDILDNCLRHVEDRIVPMFRRFFRSDSSSD